MAERAGHSAEVQFLMESGLHRRVVAERNWHALPRVFRVLAAQTADSVLLETAKPNGSADKSLLFLHPREQLVAYAPQDVPGVLEAVDRYTDAGDYLAGYFSYEVGEVLAGMPARSPEQAPGASLVWLGVFGPPIEFDHRTGLVRRLLSEIAVPTSAVAEAVTTANGIAIPRTAYAAALVRIAEYLAAGDTYQVNFTDSITGQTAADPLALYETLLRQQPVPFAAFVNCDPGPILSFSPELFYRTDRGQIVVRPMKGTWRRGNDLAEDSLARERLRNDEKNRSEHVMIVDLLRNDFGRICKYGSVKVDELFAVETYKTVLQMTSTCSGQLQEGLRPSQVFANLFPSGSITGAPKLRTMEIIRELERQPRGVYTGAIGYFAPAGKACFNVAIRTVVLDGDTVSMGVGGGITADSDAESEYEECRLKASFLTQVRPAFALFETMLCEGGIALLDRHMERLASSAEYFQIRFDRGRLEEELRATVVRCGEARSKVRVELDEAGLWSVAADALQAVDWHGRVLLCDERVDSGDVFLRHKTTHRRLYDETLAAARLLGFDEILFLNERHELSEGAISNVFLKLDGLWVTPPLSAGALPGVQRGHLLESLPGAALGTVGVDALARVEAILLCNALRGVRAVASIERADGSVLWMPVEHRGGAAVP